MAGRARLAVLLSGAGRTLENLLGVIARAELDAEIVAVVSSKPGVRGLEIAATAGLPATTIERRTFDSDEAFTRAILDWLSPYAPHLIVHAGFLRKLVIPPAWERRMLNIHPSLIPESGAMGKGFYGDRVHAAVLAGGATRSGATVHLVDNEYDHGPVLAQTVVPVLPDDTVESLAARVFAAECELYPKAISAYLRDNPWVLQPPFERKAIAVTTYKQPVVASRGVVTTNHPEASAAGLEVLAMGGNAIDAAVAALFSLSVVEPMMVSPMGAGFFVIHHGATGEVTTIDNYATAPAAAYAGMFEPVPGSLENETVGGVNDVGHLAVGVPGALAGWAHAAERFGRLPLSELVAPAIRQARRGFLTSPYLAFCIEQEVENLKRFPATAEIFLPGGAPPAPGDRVVRADYAATLERIGANGPAEFVSGETAQLIVAEMERGGGLITLDDLAGYRLHERKPVRGSYRGYEIVSMGPVSSGGTHIVQMLKILEGFDIGGLGFGAVERVHLVAEALKIAFADRFRYLADPATTDVPVDWLTSTGYAVARRAEIGGESRQYAAGERGAGGESTSTTHLNVADAEGNVVSATQTLNSLFGSRVTATGSGMLLNNTMRLLDPVPGRTNSIAPGKLILSSMSPTLVLKDGRPVLAIGTPGGHRIFAAVLQGIMNVIDFGMSAQEAVEAPRVWTMGPVLEIEDTFPDLAAVVAGLEQRGHTVSVVPKIAGGMSAIALDRETGLMTGAGCWRADGAPAGLSGGGARLVDEIVWK